MIPIFLEPSSGTSPHPFELAYAARAMERARGELPRVDNRLSSLVRVLYSIARGAQYALAFQRVRITLHGQPERDVIKQVNLTAEFQS